MRGYRTALLLPLLLGILPGSSTAQPVRYVRYSVEGTTSYGILEGDRIRQLAGLPFQGARPTGRTVALSQVRLLAPGEPGKVIAVGLNYKSHLGERPAAEYPGLFAKLPKTDISLDQLVCLT